MKLAYCTSCKTAKVEPDMIAVTDTNRPELARMDALPGPGQIVVYCESCRIWRPFVTVTVQES